MKGYLILLAVIGVWVLLQRVILPKMGVQTGMSDACQVTRKEPNDDQPQPEKDHRSGYGTD